MGGRGGGDASEGRMGRVMCGRTPCVPAARVPPPTLPPPPSLRPCMCLPTSIHPPTRPKAGPSPNLKVRMHAGGVGRMAGGDGVGACVNQPRGCQRSRPARASCTAPRRNPPPPPPSNAPRMCACCAPSMSNTGTGLSPLDFPCIVSLPSFGDR